jgi:NAD(P)-dependent dehydrogenase (short-subunit alcohol dehydrogenase family)
VHERTAVISGSASGMGAATAATLREAGQRVIGIDLHDADVLADLGTPEGRSRAVADVLRLSGGRIDSLVLCAGISPRNPDRRVVSVNYFGAAALVDELAQALAAGDAPAAVAISSAVICSGWYGLISAESVERCLAGDEEGAGAAAEPVPGSGYASAKLALALHVRRTAASPAWIDRGMTLNAIAPGVIRTPMTAANLDRPDWVSSVPPPMGRVGEAWEVAGTIAFLLGPCARFITGQVLFIDGGAEVARDSALVAARSALDR